MIENLEKLTEKYAFPKRDLKSLVEIADVESYANLKLPVDYVFYLENYFGIDQFIGVEFVKLWSIEEIIQSNKNYKIVQELPHTIGIGTNGSGEFIGIVMNQLDGLKIVLAPFIGLNSQDHIEIGHSFTDFLDRLDKGVDWFD
jgi:hypothetical protein